MGKHHRLGAAVAAQANRRRRSGGMEQRRRWWTWPAGYHASGDRSRPRGHALDQRDRKARRGGRRARRCVAAITKRASAASSASASMDVRRVRQSGKFPNASVAPLRPGRQCKPLKLQEIGSSANARVYEYARCSVQLRSDDLGQDVERP